jgi:hypothetical protein
MRQLTPLAVTLLLGLAGAGLAFAQGGSSGSGAANAPSASASASDAPPPRPMAGYSYSDPKKGQARPSPQSTPVVKHTPQASAKATGPIATLPGFETLGDGSTRVFVQLTQSVPVEERKAKGSLTYVLKGAHVTIHNNTNPLVTVHFNTPVTQARLKPSGADLLLLIDLRAATSPAWKMTTAKDNTAILQIDFPKGTFLPEASKDKG